MARPVTYLSTRLVLRVRTGGVVRLLRPGTVLAVPQVRVFARWMSCSRAASIEMQVTGIGGNHRNVAIREGTIHVYDHRGPS